MARTGKEKGPSIDRDRKIVKLSKMIKAKERELAFVERKLDDAKTKVSVGTLSKGDYRRIHIDLVRERKAVRGAITRLERSRLNRERRLKDRSAEKEAKEQERQERREQRAKEREMRREERARGKSGAEEGEED